MRSIRFSLILYFLLLMALSLGGVSWFVYRTTTQTLYDKEASTRDLIVSEYESQYHEARIRLDRDILHQARFLATSARFSKPITEPFNALGVLSTPLNPNGLWTMSLWLAEGANPRIVWYMFEKRPLEILIESSDQPLVPLADDNHAQGFFQAFGKKGQTIQRSESMKDLNFTLDANLRKGLTEIDEHFDEIEPRPGLKLRRVTLKTRVQQRRPSGFPVVWRFLFNRPKAQNETPGDPPAAKRPARAGDYDGPPVIFLQYASDTALLQATHRELQKYRDAKLAELDEGTREALSDLKARLLAIYLAMFVATVGGGFLLIRIGLNPLARLSDAVSQVSEKDFRLKIDQRQLPRELQPIAARLSRTLDLLQRAFDREKQAAADISHELRTPLSAIMTTLDVALRRQRSPAEYRELLEECRTSGQHMTVLVERLLSLARLDAGAVALKNEPLDAAVLAHECANLVRPLADARGVSLSVHADQPAPLEGDPDKLREVLTNLLHNAIQYNRPDGSIDVDVHRDNGNIRLAVRDTGVGIPAEARQRIFERFYRADPSRHSDTTHAGLGLAIVKSYLDLMGATIGVQSSQQGSTFVIDLPASKPSSPKA